MRFVAPWGKVICPFCFTKFHLSKAARRPLSPTAPEEADEALGKHLSIPPPRMKKVDTSHPASRWTRMIRRIIVHSDGMADWKKICPECHLPLSHKAANGELTDEIFAIIGARSSGKSNYFGVLLKLLETRYSSELKFSFYDQETFSLGDMKSVGSCREYRRRYGQRLFEDEQRMAIDQTLSALNNQDIRIPLIYRLECRKRWVHYVTRPLSRVAAMNIVIYDASGEDIDDPALFEHFCRYLLCAKGILFLIDPLQYPGLRNQLPPDLRRRLPRIEGDPTEIVARVISMFEARAGVPAGGKIKVPVAFALTKSDMLRCAVHPSSEILRDCSHAGGFNAPNCERVGEEVVECITQWNSPQLVNLAKARFGTSAFFAVSALGELPDEHLCLRSVSPLRVGDPLLWLLWQRGYISAQRT